MTAPSPPVSTLVMTRQRPRPATCPACGVTMVYRDGDGRLVALEQVWFGSDLTWYLVPHECQGRL